MTVSSNSRNKNTSAVKISTVYLLRFMRYSLETDKRTDSEAGLNSPQCSPIIRCRPLKNCLLEPNESSSLWTFIIEITAIQYPSPRIYLLMNLNYTYISAVHKVC